MKAKEILKNVCVYLGKEEILSSSIFEENGEELTEEQMAEVNKIIKCINLVQEEIATEYLRVLKEKEVTLTNGEIDARNIDENIFEIISIKNKFGKSLKYKYVNGKIVCLTNKAIITYSTYPKSVVGLEDDVESFAGKISARVLGYGVASEYCYLEMLYDDATIWETRFKNALLVLARKKGEIKLKKRGWL